MASKARRTASAAVDETGEVTMFATIKSLIPEPRQADQPRRYVGRHRHLDVVVPGEPDTDDVGAVEGDPTAEEPVPVGSAAVGTASVGTASVGSASVRSEQHPA
jgi:hypothetical protein